MPPESFTLERYAENSINYFEQMVDEDDLPYFNVFWTSPAQAAHDWPDFGDVMSRQLHGAIFLKAMTGREVSNLKAWHEKILKQIDPSDGFLHRPETSFSQPVADWGDAALSLYALVTLAIEVNEHSIQQVVARMAEGMLRRLRSGDLPNDCFAVKGLMVAARRLKCDAAFEAARLLVEKLILKGHLFSPDNTFGPWGHMHSNLRSMTGAADFALAEGDSILFDRMDALYRFVKSTGTRFGFIPEAIGRKGDIISCETCALMDFAGIGVTLANHGHQEYWGDMERLVRNHYVESQVQDVSWLEVDNSRSDTAQFTWRKINQRILGAWAGWSSPNHLLAACETLNHHWGGPELRDKTRLLQNCCGGSGVHGLFTLWKNAVQFENDTLSVNIHLDKMLTQAEIRCDQPYLGNLEISLHSDCEVRVRIPEFTTANEMGIQVNDHGIQHAQTPINNHPVANQDDNHHLPVTVRGNYLELGRFREGENIKITYPLPIQIENISVGNPGFRQWHYQVTWKGDTVVRMEPIDNEAQFAFSDFDKKDVPVFYGLTGPGLLYQREGLLQNHQPRRISVYPDDGRLNFWKM